MVFWGDRRIGSRRRRGDLKAIYEFLGEEEVGMRPRVAEGGSEITDDLGFRCTNCGVKDLRNGTHPGQCDMGCTCCTPPPAVCSTDRIS